MKNKEITGYKTIFMQQPYHTKPLPKKLPYEKVGGGGRGLKLPVLCDKMVASQGSAQS